jgi:hypothetical protein
MLSYGMKSFERGFANDQPLATNDCFHTLSINPASKAARRGSSAMVMNSCVA